MNLLIVDEDFNIEINPETLLIPAFKTLIKRTKVGRDDADGRRKLIAKKELAYIKHMCSFDGPYSYLPPRERHIRLANDLFEKADWEPDAIVKEAMSAYEEHCQTPSSRILSTTINSLYKANTIIDTLINQIEQDMQNEKHKKGLNNKKGEIVSGVELMLKDLTALLKTSQEVPKSIEILEKLEEKIKKERMEKSARSRGGKKISDRER